MSFAVIVATLFCYATYRGPFRWLADVQLAWTSQYNVMITALATACVWFCVLRFLTNLSHRARNRWRRQTTVQHDGPARPLPLDSQTSPGPAGNTGDNSELPVRGSRGSYLLLLTLLCWALAALCGFQWWRAAEWTELSVADYENHVPPKSGYVTLTDGMLLPEATVTVVREGTVRRHQSFTPCVSTGWHPGDPVSVFVASGDRQPIDRITAARPTGLIQVTGLPGVVQGTFQDSEFPPAADYLLVDTEGTPEQYRRRGRSFLIAAVFATLFLLLRWITDRFRRKPSTSNGGHARHRVFNPSDGDTA